VTFDPIAERTEYTRELTKLKLWYVWWLGRNEDVDFDAAMQSHVGIARMTSFWGDAANKSLADPEGWQRVADELRAVFAKHAGESSADEIETEGLDLLWPYMASGVQKYVNHMQQWLKNAVGCFRYEFAPYYADKESGDHLTLHVSNAYQPDSPFEHVPEMVESLKEILKRSREERPDVDRAQCGSWLNSFPPFAGLFPPSWVEDARPGQPGGHAGWWGQFMNRRGGFHFGNARRLRKTGQFPFRHLLSRCRTADLQDHLDHLDP